MFIYQDFPQSEKDVCVVMCVSVLVNVVNVTKT